MKTKLFLIGAFIAATLLIFSFTFSNPAKEVVKQNAIDTVQEDFTTPVGGSGSVRI